MLDKQKKSPLFYAALYGSNYIDIIKLIIENGAKVTASSLKFLTENYNIESDVIDILESAIIVNKMFERDGIKNINDGLRSHLQKDFKFKIDSEKNEVKAIKFSNESYKKCFQNLLVINFKDVITKDVKTVANFLEIINDNMHELSSLCDISLKEFYQGSVLDTLQLCKGGDYSKLSLEAAATIHVLDLLSQGKLSLEQTKKTLPTQIFETFETFKNMVNSDVSEMNMDATGQIASYAEI